MTPPDPNSRSHRKDVTQRRKGAREDERARVAEAERDLAEQRRRSFEQDLKKYQRRRLVGWLLVGLGVALFVLHFLAHAGTVVLFSLPLQDLLIGYPSAAVLMIAAVFMLGQVHPAERR